jgi:hypothetical protein
VTDLLVQLSLSRLSSALNVALQKFIVMASGTRKAKSQFSAGYAEVAIFDFHVAMLDRRLLHLTWKQHLKSTADDKITANYALS